jgi:nitroimidazol reductase NimA-like FMN-containing flavoprotein (pyridoxamine 5'-phosphate oxidase superfamily)
LRRHSVGRLGFVRDGQPVILPVNYVVDGETIVFRTGAGTRLDALRDARVAFEVDAVDTEHRTGWSVLVQGRAREVTASDELDYLARARLAPWAGGEKAHWIRIVADTVTGRRITRAGSPPPKPQ